jgi:NADH dehydrogenase
MATSVVVVGGGTVGFEVASRLGRAPAGELDVTVVDDVGAAVYRPLLPEVAGGVIDARHAAVPLQAALPHARVVEAQARGLDHAGRRLTVRHLDGRETELAYDQLVVAPGSVTRLLPVPGLVDHALGFQTIAEAVQLRDHVLDCVQRAGDTADPDGRRRALTMVFVGGGYSGVEAAGELQDLAADACAVHPDLSPADLRVVLVEATDTILPMVTPGLREVALDELGSRAVDVRLETTVERVDDGVVHLSDGEAIAAGTLVWCAGVRAHPTVDDLALPTDEAGRVRVDPCLAVEGRDGVWSAGDCAAVPDLVAGGTCPPSAQYALRQGRRIATNIRHVANGDPPRPFRYRQIGELITLGRLRAVGDVRGLRLRGRPAWLLRAAYHIARFPTWQRKVRISAEWLIRLTTRRDTTSLGFAHDAGAAVAAAADAADQDDTRPPRVL